MWFTGLSGAGKSTLAAACERLLVAAAQPAYVLDGDNLRHGLNADLDFSPGSRTENVRRVGEVARLFADAGVVALVPIISPYRSDRDGVRAAHEAMGVPFVEVYVATPLNMCESRDTKGLYARARAGEITNMTGVNAPYEPPLDPELRVEPPIGAELDLAACVQSSALQVVASVLGTLLELARQA